MTQKEKNPFILTGAIPAEYFCDRQEESKRLIRTVTQGGNLCLISPRRMGKSKLVRFCYDILHTSSLREFTYAFGQSVFETLRSQSRKMLTMLTQGLKSLQAKFGFDPINYTPTFSLELGDITTPEFTLKEIFQCLEQADKPCIVTFDEFQQTSSTSEMSILSLPEANVIWCRKYSSHRHALSIIVPT